MSQNSEISGFVTRFTQPASSRSASQLTDVVAGFENAFLTLAELTTIVGANVSIARCSGIIAPGLTIATAAPATAQRELRGDQRCNVDLS